MSTTDIDDDVVEGDEVSELNDIIASASAVTGDDDALTKREVIFLLVGLRLANAIECIAGAIGDHTELTEAMFTPPENPRRPGRGNRGA